MNEQKQRPLMVGAMVCIGICAALVIAAWIGHYSKLAPKADPQPPYGAIGPATLPSNASYIMTQQTMRTDWGQEEMQNEMERIHAALPKKLAATPSLPAFSPVMHTQSIPQVMVQCTSAGAQKSEIWPNTLGTAAVVGGFAWLGVDMGAIEDAYVLAINLSNGDVWDIATNEDHYSDRTGGANSANIPFGHPPFVWLLNPTDQMEILIGCRGLANYHIGASLTFQYLSPAPVPTPAVQGSVKP